jgi:hypothetical protein
MNLKFYRMMIMIDDDNDQCMMTMIDDDNDWSWW